jgi:polymorphic toxin system nucleotidyltransferase-like protein
VDKGTVHQTFAAAVDALVGQLQQDRSVLAALLCGSLSHDTVWQKSDVDLVLITVDDKIHDNFVALYADGVNIHAMLMTRSEFRKTVEASLRNSFMHSFLAKGRLLYTHDPTIADLCATLGSLGERDMQLALLNAGTGALPLIYKAHKWFLTRGDLEYTALWILYAATPLARIEILSARQLTDREVIPQALKLNPAFFKRIYTDLLNAKKTRAAVQGALDAVDEYVATRARSLFGAVFAYLDDAGEARSVTDIETHFARQCGIEGVTTACEYLADQGLIGKASVQARLTRRSTVPVQELAFFPLDHRPHGR